jgi:hypothetical protein
MNLKTDLPNGVQISTVSVPDVGLGYRFETMVFGAIEDDVSRYHSQNDAQKGHEAMIKKWETWNPPNGEVKKFDPMDDQLCWPRSDLNEALTAAGMKPITK